MRNLIIIAILIAAIIGCSSNEVGVTVPDNATQIMQVDASTPHGLWGYWQGIIDAEAGVLEFIPLRAGELHLNALRFLEPPPNFRLTVEGPLQISGNVIDVNIGIRHPFSGLDQYTGFDVCGIFMAGGSQSGYTDAGIVMPGPYDTRLLNQDGYSRWWNPVEFPVNPGTIFGYTDGLLGAPHANADFNSTINGYKYFCDDLDDPEDPLGDVNPEGRGVFSAGLKNVRHYEIYMASGLLVFNYAIDACWKKPSGSPPVEVPGDFLPQANRAEAWRASVTEIENTLWNLGSTSGGDLRLLIDVYDWFNVEMNTIRVESPGNCIQVESSTPTGGGTGYSTYEIDIFNATPSTGEIELLISVISEEENFQEFITSVNTTAYYTYTAEVSGIASECSSDPAVVSDLPTVNASGIKAIGNYLYLADYHGGLKVIDITDKTNPVILGTVDTYAFGLDVNGDYAYLGGIDGGFKIIDVSDKTNPVMVAQVDTFHGWDVEVIDDIAYFADGSGLMIFDVTDKSNPVHVSSAPSGDDHGIDVEGNYAYMADNDFGLRIVDITDHTNPQIVGSVSTSKPQSVAVEGNYAYIADNEAGLKIINIADKTDPLVVGSMPCDNRAYGIAVSNDCVYLCDYTAGFKIVDVSDKANPITVGFIDADKAFYVALQANYAYLSDYNMGVKTIQLW